MCVKVKGVKEVDQHPRYDSNVVRRAVDQIMDQSFGLWTLTPDK